MANNLVSWSLLQFARTYGPKFQVGEFTNKETAEVFKSCILTNSNGERTFLHFSSKMGPLTPAQIAAQKNDLQVVQIESGSYILCKQGENTWEDVDLGL